MKAMLLAMMVVLFVGLAPKALADDFKVGLTDPQAIPATDATNLGVTWSRETVKWHGESQFTGSLSFTPGVKTYVMVFGNGSYAPDTPAERQAYASFVHSLLVQYPQVAGITVWNEPMPGGLWPIAPEQYVQLLQVVAPVIRAAGALVISAPLHPNQVAEPQPWLGVFAAAGHLLDVIAINPYWAADHDADFVKAARQAMGWPIPVWVSEDGIESQPDAPNLGLYLGTEQPAGWFYWTSEANQALVVAEHMKYAYCAGISVWSGFLLVDEQSLLHGWQSGLVRPGPDGSLKPAYAAFAATSALLQSGTFSCKDWLAAPKPPPILPRAPADTGRHSAKGSYLRVRFLLENQIYSG